MNGGEPPGALNAASSPAVSPVEGTLIAAQPSFMGLGGPPCYIVPATVDVLDRIEP